MYHTRIISRFFRHTPVKLLILLSLIAVALLNLSLVYYEGYGQTKSTEHKQHENWYKQLQKLIQKGFQFTKIVVYNDKAMVTFSKKHNQKIKKNDKNILLKHRNKGNVQDIDNSVNNKIDVRSKLKEIFENIQLENNRENEANVDVTPPTDDITKCPNNILGHMIMTSYGSCKPHQPSLEGCREASQTYYYDPKECDSFKGDICTIDVTVRNDHKMLNARCNRSLCRDGGNTLAVKTLDHDTGMHEIVGQYSSIKQLENNLSPILKSCHSKGYNYVFIRCQSRDGNWVHQLLPLDPRYTVQESRSKRPQNLLNINILLIDSVARDHFYRSLPKTIQTFKRLATSPSSSARVFDFELFQAVEGHTAENTHALFTGSLFSPNKSRDTVRPVGMETLFGRFKQAGYQTMWQEDLCWEGRWGLITDLALQYNWEDLAPKLKKVHIDQTGITHSSCEILQSYGVISPFAKPSDKICYNGKYQHSYFLNYIQDTFKAITSNLHARPMLSYTTLSVAHDMYGRRTQTIDKDLARFAESMAKESNTLTIMLADHGNTYTWYATTQEGKFEMFHPSLFMIVPDNVGKLLGAGAMQALRTNQRRLLTMIDLHHTLMTLAQPVPIKGVEPRGVFVPISSTRTCDDLELKTPNMCVCEGWDSPTSNDTLKLAYSEFAIGELNNKLTRQGDGLSLWRSCNRLQPLSYRNVRVRNMRKDSGSLITSLDIVLPTGNVAKHKEDIFHVEIQSKQSSKTTSLDMKLIHYERLSPFGVYGVCADKGVNGKLCICSKTEPRTRKKEKLKLDLLLNTSKHFQGILTLKPIDKRCLFLIQRVHGKGDAHAYEVANTCTDRPRVVMVTISEVSNMRTSRDRPARVVVPPGSVVFVLSAMKNIQEYEGSVTVIAIAA